MWQASLQGLQEQMNKSVVTDVTPYKQILVDMSIRLGNAENKVDVKHTLGLAMRLTQCT